MTRPRVEKSNITPGLGKAVSPDLSINLKPIRPVEGDLGNGCFRLAKDGNRDLSQLKGINKIIIDEAKSDGLKLPAGFSGEVYLLLMNDKSDEELKRRLIKEYPQATFYFGDETHLPGGEIIKKEKPTSENEGRVKQEIRDLSLSAERVNTKRSGVIKERDELAKKYNLKITFHSLIKGHRLGQTEQERLGNLELISKQIQEIEKFLSKLDNPSEIGLIYVDNNSSESSNLGNNKEINLLGKGVIPESEITRLWNGLPLEASDAEAGFAASSPKDAGEPASPDSGQTGTGFDEDESPTVIGKAPVIPPPPPPPPVPAPVPSPEPAPASPEAVAPISPEYNVEEFSPSVIKNRIKTEMGGRFFYDFLDKADDKDKQQKLNTLIETLREIKDSIPYNIILVFYNTNMLDIGKYSHTILLDPLTPGRDILEAIKSAQEEHWGTPEIIMKKDYKRVKETLAAIKEMLAQTKKELLQDWDDRRDLEDLLMEDLQFDDPRFTFQVRQAIRKIIIQAIN